MTSPEQVKAYQITAHIEKEKHGLFRWLAEQMRYLGHEAADGLKDAFKAGRHFLPEVPQFIAGFDDDDAPVTLIDRETPIRLKDMNQHLLGLGLAAMGHTPDFGRGPVGSILSGKKSVFMGDVAPDETSQKSLLSGWLKFRDELDETGRSWREYIPQPVNINPTKRNTPLQHSYSPPPVDPQHNVATPINSKVWDEVLPQAYPLPSQPWSPPAIPPRDPNLFGNYQAGYQTTINRYQAPHNLLRDRLFQIQQLATQQENLKQLETLNKHLAQQNRAANWKRFEEWEQKRAQAHQKFNEEALKNSFKAAQKILDILIIEDIKIILDPHASTMEKTFAVAGFLPIGKAPKAIKLLGKVKTALKISDKGFVILKKLGFNEAFIEKRLEQISSFLGRHPNAPLPSKVSNTHLIIEGASHITTVRGKSTALLDFLRKNGLNEGEINKYKEFFKKSGKRQPVKLFKLSTGELYMSVKRPNKVKNSYSVWDKVISSNGDTLFSGHRAHWNDGTLLKWHEKYPAEVEILSEKDFMSRIQVFLKQ